MNNNSIYVDRFIDYLVLNFDRTPIVDIIIRKVHDMYDMGNVTQYGNTILCNRPLLLRKVTVDSSKSLIEFSEQGTKLTNSGKKIFSNNLFYNVFNGTGTVLKQTDDAFVSKELSSFTTVLFHDVYEDGKCVSSKYCKNNSKKISTFNGNPKIINNNYECLTYYLFEGDSLKMINDNDSIKYYYCNSEDKLFEISEKRFNSIKESSTDFNSFFNNSFVRKIHV